eukprot:TRINITY_DN248_c1_g1_i1.p1 TRINITY_DN248_c1_g1~~TRINITY_DN248_c1_g1_i1.p1  ORF type:complete len:277 (+),score=59.40 TRINITY_DN248_c1_g1_i1:129-959(+)
MFVPKKNGEIKDFSNSTLILSTNSIGWVGQLTLDLLLNSIEDFQQIGWFYSQHLLPIIGNDPFDSTTGDLFCNLQIYEKVTKDHTFVILQQRSPIMKNHNQDFAVEIVNWIKESKFKEVLYLVSADATRRIDTQIQGEQYRIISINRNYNDNSSSSESNHNNDNNDNNDNNNINDILLKRMNISNQWKQLEINTYENFFREGCFTTKFLSLCKKSNDIKILSLIVFCSEGININQSLSLANWVNTYLNVQSINPNSNDHSNEGFSWKIPASWNINN